MIIKIMLFKWLPRTAFGLLALIELEQFAYGEELFGRFEVISKTCEYQLSSGSREICRVVQLDRKSAEVIGVRFIGRGKGKGSRQELTFVTFSNESSVPLTCSNGECSLKEDSWIGQVSSVAEKNFNERGLSQGLPKAWPVKGECTLSQKHLSCRSQSFSGELLTGEARL